MWEKEIIDRLIETTEKNGGNFFHIYLNTPKNIWKERIIERGINSSLTFERAEFFYNSLQELKKTMNMIELDSSKISANEVCDKIIEFLK